MMRTIRSHWVPSALATVVVAVAAIAVRSVIGGAVADKAHLRPRALVASQTSFSGKPRPVTFHHESGPSIDGSVSPELIPDEVAYSLFLRMLLANDNSSDALKRQRSYVKHILRNASTLSGETSPEHITSLTQEISSVAVHNDHEPRAEDVAAMYRFIASYDQRLKDFDSAGGKSGDEMALLNEIITSMESHLGDKLALRIHRYVKEEFKRKVKIVS